MYRTIQEQVAEMSGEPGRLCLNNIVCNISHSTSFTSRSSADGVHSRLRPSEFGLSVSFCFDIFLWVPSLILERVWTRSNDRIEGKDEI